MSDTVGGDLSFNGSVSKLVQIGTNNGPLFLLNQEPTRDRLRKVPDGVRVTGDESEIGVVIVSKRFGRRVGIRIPPGIRAGALTEILVDLLTLPRNYRVEELYLEFGFQIHNYVSGKTYWPLLTIS